MATEPELNVPQPYRAYMQVFLEADSQYMLYHGSHDQAIELTNGKQLLSGPIYNLSEMELDTLCSYHKVQLK